MDFDNSEILNSLWNKLYKRDIIIEHNIKFPKDVKTGEDFIFSLEYLSRINIVVFCKEELYYYVKRRNRSITYQYIDNMYGKGLEINYIVRRFFL